MASCKEDLAGGKLPSGDFGENAAWWWIMILALNLNAAMKRLVLKRIPRERYVRMPPENRIARRMTG